MKSNPVIKEHLVHFFEILEQRNQEISAKFSDIAPLEDINEAIHENFSFEKEKRCADYYLNLLTELDLKDFEEFEKLLEGLKNGDGMINYYMIL